MASAYSFYAYFVSLPGRFKIESIEVFTDQYHYTKTVGKDVEFVRTELKNLAVDLSKAAKEGITSKVWYKASVLENNIDYIIVSQGKMLNNGAEDLTGETAPSDQNGVIEFETAPAKTVIWTAKYNEIPADNDLVAGHFTLENNKQYLQRILLDSQAHTYKMGVGSVPTTVKYYAWEYDGEYLYHISNSSASFYCYFSGSSWMTGSTKTDAKPVSIYTTRPPRELSFSAGAAEYDLAGDGSWIASLPSLVPEGVAVTYSSSNEDVATVNTTTGEVTIKGIIGSTVITAIAAGNAEYQAGSASYELTVTDSSVKPKTYRKVTSTTDLDTDTQYILVREEANKAFKPILNSSGTYFTKSTANAVDVTISEGVIKASDLDDCEITLEEGYYLYVASVSKYLYPGNSGDSALGAENKTSGHTVAISFSNGIVTIARSNDSKYHLYWSSSNYFSGISSNESNYAANFCLYKLDDGRQVQNPTFDPAGPFTVDKATETFTAPVLKDYHGNVTYMSDDENVAKVNPTSGAVEIVGRGEVVITATVAGDDAYKPAVAYYELEVTDSSVKPKTYRRVTSVADLEVGTQYLLVYESTPYVFKPILEEGGNTFLKDASNKVSVTISSGTIISAELENCELTLSSGYHLYVALAKKYLYPHTTNSGRNTYLQAEDSPESALTITINSNYTALVAIGNDYLNYSSNENGRFSSTTNRSPNPNVYLYKLDDGTTPPTPEKQDRELSFGTENFIVTLGQTMEFPTLSGVSDAALEGVTYSSSDPSVASIVPETGVVTPLAAGSTTITASATANDSFLEGSASYVLTVVEGSVVIPYYTKVNALSDLPTATTASGDYIFVYEDGNKAYVFMAICDGTPTGPGSGTGAGSGYVELTKAGSAIEVSLTANGIAATDAVKACSVQLAHHTTATRNDWNIKPVSLDTYWIRINNSGTSQRIQAMTSAGYSSGFAFSDTGNNLTVKRTDSNNTAYLRYNGSDNCFEATATESKVSLYKLSE